MKNLNEKNRSWSRDRAREPYTREEVEAIFDEEMRVKVKHLGADNYYVRLQREYYKKALKDFNEGKPICLKIDRYIENGMDYELCQMSDGTVLRVCYGYYD